MDRNLFCVLLLALVIFTSGDECSFKRKVGYKIEDIKKCVHRLPFSEAVRTSAQTTLSYMYSSYAYKDIIKDSRRSGSKYNISAKIEERLGKLKSDQFTYDYEFHVKVADIIGSAKDPHLAYRAPCYSMFAFLQPFRIGSYLWNGVQTLIVKPPLPSLKYISDLYNQLFPGVDSSKWHGYHVKSINGRNAMTVMSEFAEIYGWGSYEQQVRFNQVLKIDWFTYILGEDGFPEPIVTYTFVNPADGTESTAQFGYISIVMADVNDVNHFKQICAYPDQLSTSLRSIQTNGHGFELLNSANDYNSIPLRNEEKRLLFPWPMSSKIMGFIKGLLGTTTTQKLSKLQSNFLRDSLSTEWSDENYQYWSTVHGNRVIWKQHIIDNLKDKTERTTKRQSSSKETIISNSDFSLHVWKSETIIMQMKTFLVPNYGDFITQFVDKFTFIASKYKIKNMIIDLRGNGGGYVDLAFQLAKWLVPRIPSEAYPIVDYPHNKLNDQIFACDQHSLFYTSYDPSTGKLISFGNNTWYKQGIKRERGGVLGTYSSPIFMQTPRGIPSFPGRNPFYAFGMPNLTLLTDGDCGSACGMFLSLLQQLREARVVSLGGILGEGPMGVASFYGATVKQFADIERSLYLMKLFGGCTFEPIEPLPMRGVYTTSQLEMYPWVPKVAAFEKWKTDMSIPLGFLFTSADFHLDQWSIDENDNQDQLYASTVETFNYCAQHEFLMSNCQPNGTRFGIYGYPCINITARTFDTTNCKLYACEENYHLDESGSVCVENRTPDLSDPYTITNAIRDAIIKVVIGILIILSILCVCCNASILLVIYCLCCKKRARIPKERSDYERMTGNGVISETQSA